MDAFLELIMLIGIFVGVLALTYFVTQKIAMMNKKMVFNKNMQIMEVLQVAQGQYLYIVKVGEAYHLIGSTQKGGMNYCTQLEGDKLQFDGTTPKSFQEQLSQFVKGKQVKDHEEK